MNPLTCWCFYIIPKFIYGIPLYNLEECLNYIVSHLNKNGFMVNYTHPNLLLISWVNASKPKKSVNYLSNNYSFAENFKKQSKNINNIKKEEVIIDSKHPDGFRLAEDKDLYKNYGNTPVRYIQEIKYKYKEGPAPTDSVVKKFDGLDPSTFPADPEQKKALAKYQMMHDKLSPLQKQQLEKAQNTKK